MGDSARTTTHGAAGELALVHAAKGSGSHERAGRPSRARRFEIDADARLGALIDAAFAECLRHLIANVEPGLDADDPEGVHQLRVALRRTRSALRLFREALHPGHAKAVRAEIHRVGEKLSAARDWDVFVTETLAPLMAERSDDAGLERLQELAQAERRAAHETVRAELESGRFAESVARMRAHLGEGGWRPKRGSKRARRLERRARGQAVRLLEHRVERVHALGCGLERLSAGDLHRLRIRVKQLRYAGELLAPLYPRKPARRYLKRLAVLQDELGRMNDGRVAEALVDRLVAGVAPDERAAIERAAGVVIGWSHRGAIADREAMRRTWKGFASADDFWEH